MTPTELRSDSQWHSSPTFPALSQVPHSPNKQNYSLVLEHISCYPSPVPVFMLFISSGNPCFQLCSSNPILISASKSQTSLHEVSSHPFLAPLLQHSTLCFLLSMIFFLHLALSKMLISGCTWPHSQPALWLGSCLRCGLALKDEQSQSYFFSWEFEP